MKTKIQRGKGKLIISPSFQGGPETKTGHQWLLPKGFSVTSSKV